jgi:hypothetical protein
MFDLPWLALAASLAADRVPVIDVEPHCREVARRAAPVGDPQACLRVEQAARDQLLALWPQFVAADKSHCLQLSSIAVKPTYTELLTCLELAREARAVREKEKRGTTGRR